MNFPNVPKRSSADDELDHVLNAWAKSHSELAEESPREAQSCHSEGSLRFSASARPGLVEESPRGAQLNSTTTDALEFHRWADEALRTEPAASGPAVGTWSRILHHLEQKSPRGRAEMNASTTSALNDAAIVYDSRPYNQREWSWSKFANIAATVAIVFAVTVGGWFAMSQLPPGGDGRFAALQASREVAQSGTCDVEPLTVDDVMAIVENPYRYMNDQALPENAEANAYTAAAENDYMVARVDPSWEAFNSVNRVQPSEEVFEEARIAADMYILCAHEATSGQYWALMHPFWVQEIILAGFPVYADEASVRAFVEEVIDQPMSTAEGYYRLSGYYQTYGDVTIIANPDIEKSEQILYSTPYDEPVIAMGVVIAHENGEVIIETGSTGYPHQIKSGSLTSRPIVVMQKSEITGRWYVLPYFSS